MNLGRLEMTLRGLGLSQSDPGKVHASHEMEKARLQFGLGSAEHHRTAEVVLRELRKTGVLDR